MKHWLPQAIMRKGLGILRTCHMRTSATVTRIIPITYFSAETTHFKRQITIAGRWQGFYIPSCEVGGMV